MSVDNKLAVSISFADVDCRNSFQDVIGSGNSELSFKFNGFKDFNIDTTFDDISIVRAQANEDLELVILLEGSESEVIVSDLVKNFSGIVKDAYILQVVDFEFFFSLYDSYQQDWKQCNSFLNECCRDIFRKENISLSDKLMETISLYQGNELTSDDASSNDDLFSKIADVSIDPFDDGYIHEIENALLMSSSGETVVTAAIKAKNLDVVDHVVQWVDMDSILTPNKSGETPLKIASECDNKDLESLVRRLVEECESLN